MSILDALKTQTNSLDDLAALPQVMIMQMAQKGQIREDMLAPILGRKAEMAEAVARTKALQSGAGQQPTVMEQLMQRNASAEMPESREMGIAQLPVREDMYTQNMAGGGIVAFDEGGDVDDEYLEAQEESMLDSLMLKKRPGFSVEEDPRFGINPSKKQEENPFMPKGKTGEFAMKTAEKYGLDPSYVNKIIANETGGMKDASTAVSPAGAKGVMQLMPGTAKDMGVKDVFDPFQNIEGGVKYLAMLNKKYDDPTIAAIAYNWGPGNTDKWLKSGADVNRLPKETQKYIARLAGGGEVQSYAAGDLVKAKDSLAEGEEIVEFAPQRKTYTSDDLIEEMIKERADIRARSADDKNLALLAAGLGMMGGTSPYAFANIGQGAMKGVEQYAASGKSRAAELAAANKSLTSAMRNKGIEDLRQQEISNIKEYRKGQLEGKSDKLAREAEDKEGRLINKVDGILNRDPVIKDFTKKMEMLPPDDPMYSYYLDEIEKLRIDAYKRAGLKTPGPRAKLGKPPAPVEEPGFFERIFGSNKPKSGGTMKFDAQGNPI
jgi:hypothetical protein